MGTAFYLCNRQGCDKYTLTADLKEISGPQYLKLAEVIIGEDGPNLIDFSPPLGSCDSVTLSDLLVRLQANIEQLASKMDAYLDSPKAWHEIRSALCDLILVMKDIKANAQRVSPERLFIALRNLICRLEYDLPVMELIEDIPSYSFVMPHVSFKPLLDKLEKKLQLPSNQKYLKFNFNAGLFSINKMSERVRASAEYWFVVSKLQTTADAFMPISVRLTAVSRVKLCDSFSIPGVRFQEYSEGHVPLIQHHLKSTVVYRLAPGSELERPLHNH